MTEVDVEELIGFLRARLDEAADRATATRVGNRMWPARWHSYEAAVPPIPA